MKITDELRLIIIVLIFFFIGLLFPKKVSAYNEVSEDSAKIALLTKINNRQNLYLYKQLAIKKIFSRYNSPLISYTNTFIDVCLKYNLDCYLLPAIAGIESSFGQFIYPNSYNPFGWGGGYIIFKDWNEGIKTVAKGLKENYIDKGAIELWQIGKIYTPSSNTWVQKVDFLIKEFYNQESNYVKF